MTALDTLRRWWRDPASFQPRDTAEPTMLGRGWRLWPDGRIDLSPGRHVADEQRGWKLYVERQPSHQHPHWNCSCGQHIDAYDVYDERNYHGPDADTAHENWRLHLADAHPVDVEGKGP